MIHLFLHTSSLRKDPTISYLTRYSPEFCIVAYDDETKKKIMFIAAFEKGLYKGIKTIPFSRKTFYADLKKAFSKKRLLKIGLNYSSLSVKEKQFLTKLCSCSFVDNTKQFAALRMEKSPKELALLRKACEYTDLIYADLVKFCKKGKARTENDILRFLKEAALRYDLSFAFNPIVASGPRSSLPHSFPTDSVLQGFCVIDMGFVYKGYSSDMTRMLYFGTPTQKELESFTLVSAVYEECFNIIRSGTQAKEVDAHARERLGKHFTHALGHGIGIEVHEKPTLSPQGKEELRKNMVFTLEPGIYYPKKYGIRLEDTLVLTSSGPQSLFTSSFALQVFAKP